MILVLPEFVPSLYRIFLLHVKKRYELVVEACDDTASVTAIGGNIVSDVFEEAGAFPTALFHDKGVGFLVQVQHHSERCPDRMCPN